jgi:hypothetical protein
MAFSITTKYSKNEAIILPTQFVVVPIFVFLCINGKVANLHFVFIALLNFTPYKFYGI